MLECCGKVYCRLCLTEHKKHSNKCPECGEAGNSFNDRRVDQDVKALEVKCNNLDSGCQWVGELLSLEEHLQNCDFSLMLCPNECNKTVTYLHKDINDHIVNVCPNRKYQCPQCGEDGIKYPDREKHIEVCVNAVMQCPNKFCDASFERSALATHRSTCEYERLPCKYTELGCKERLHRKDLKMHEDDDRLHFGILTGAALEYKQQIQQLKQEINNLKEISQSKHRELFTFQLPSFSEHKNNKRTFYSPPFYSNPNGYKLAVRVDANGYSDSDVTYVSVYAGLMKGDYDDSLQWPFTGTVKFELLNQLEDSHHYTTWTTFPSDSKCSNRVKKGDRNTGLGKFKFISHSNLHYDSANNCQYLINDTLIFRISVNVPNYKPWLECTHTGLEND